jgi:histidinol-phosphate aminotransferase
VADQHPILRDAIVALPSYQSGLSEDDVRGRTGLERIVKLDSNENPLGPSPAVFEAASTALARAWRYPDRDERDLRCALGEQLGVDPRRFVFSGGSEDVLAIIYRMILRPGDEVVTVTPGFGLHAICAQVCDAKVRLERHHEDWSFPVEALTDAGARGVRAIAFSSPSNPVGAMLSESDIDTILASAGPETFIVFDEAYIEFAPREWRTKVLRRLEHHKGPWALLRTFAKAYGLAGMRVGYAVVHDVEFAEHFHKTRSPFNVNAVALAGALAAVNDQPYMENVVERVVTERARVSACVYGMGLTHAPSDGNFLFINTGIASDKIAASLLTDGVLIKPWREPGFENYIRATIGLREENDVLLQSLSKALVTAA